MRPKSGLALISPEILPASITAFAAEARDYAAHAKSDATLRAYQSDWEQFELWCRRHGARCLPAAPATVLAYLIDSSATVKVSTLQRRLVAIRDSHRGAGEELDTGSEAFRNSWRSLQRTKGQPTAKKSPVLTAELRRVLATLAGDSLLHMRDRALLLVGFAGALRRSELVSLRAAPDDGYSHIALTSDGLVVTLAQSKTDQLHEGQVIGLPYGSQPETCPVRAYQKWLEASGVSHGPVFRAINRHGQLATAALSDKAVALILKRAVRASALAHGATPEEAQARAAEVSGHSLRAGLATSAAVNNAPSHAIQRQLRHKKLETTLGYIRTGQLFQQNAAGMAGL